MDGRAAAKRGVIFARSIYDIEAAVICKPWGHANPEAYYEANDGFADLGRLSCPLLCVQSSDDNVVPFSGKYAISDATLVNLSPFIACCTTLLGGHLSFPGLAGAVVGGPRCRSSSRRRRGGCLPRKSVKTRGGSGRRCAGRRRGARPRARVAARKRPPAKPAAATPVSERRRALPSVKGVLAGMRVLHCLGTVSSSVRRRRRQLVFAHPPASCQYFASRGHPFCRLARVQGRSRFHSIRALRCRPSRVLQIR